LTRIIQHKILEPQRHREHSAASRKILLKKEFLPAQMEVFKATIAQEELR